MNSKENQKISSAVLKELSDAPRNESGLIEDGLFNNIIAKFPSTTPVVLEFQKGSVGFRESDVECAYFRNLTVKKID